MSNIYTPIDSSGLIRMIPEGDDILYSTLCKVQVISRNVRIKWQCHVLVTKSGFASYTKLEPYTTRTGKEKYKVRKKKLGMIAQFIRWEELGTNIEKPPFSKNEIKHPLNPQASKLSSTYVFYKGLNAKGFGHFCRDLWLDKIMK